jgi:CcmD family protein
MMTTRALARLLLIVCLTSVAAGTLSAQGTPPAGNPPAVQQEPLDQFVPVKTLPAQEQLPAATLVMSAYGFVWAVLLVYVWTIWRRLMKVEREMLDLTARLGEKR